MSLEGFFFILLKIIPMKPIILTHYREYMLKDIDESYLGKTLQLTWRIASIRDHGDLVFIDLREDGEVFQIKCSRDRFPDLDIITKLHKESVILVQWEIIYRSEDDINTKIKSWTIELDCKQVDVLSSSKVLPFQTHDTKSIGESLRLEYRYIDLRSQRMRDNIIMRSKTIAHMRSFFTDKDFLEIETPLLSKGTDEWSREFVVPSRLYSGKSYVLPQSPQQFKQMIMASGFDKYFQVARCFRDEDDKCDRQPEFTQLDLEMAFVSQETIISLITDMLSTLVATYYPTRKIHSRSFQKITYAEAMEKYGTDKPDIRFGLEMKDITDIVSATDFQVFKQQIQRGWIVKCFKVDQDLTKKQIEDLTKIAIQAWIWGLAYITVQPDYLQSPIVKFLGEDVSQKIVDTMQAQIGQTIFFSAAQPDIANKALDIVRREVGKLLRLYDEDELAFCRIVDFPMFEKTITGRRKFTHNPFSLPQVQYIESLFTQDNIEDILAQQYDIVLNGTEIGGGSIRAHLPEILKATYQVMGYKEEEITHSIGTMLKAFEYGVPPHGGIALGIDRLLMILQGEKSLREVILFPKTGAGQDIMRWSPSAMSKKTMSDIHIRIDEYITTQWS